MKVSYRTKLLASHTAIALAVSGILIFIADRVVRDEMASQVDSRLEEHARTIPEWFERSRHPNRLAGRLAAVIGARVTFFSQDGQAKGESLANAQPEADGPERLRALEGEIGRATRYSPLEEQEVRYIAIPGPESSVIRLGLPIGQVRAASGTILTQILLGALLCFLFAIVLAVVVARALTNRLQQTAVMAEQLGRGEWNVPAPEETRDEIDELRLSLAKAARGLGRNEAERRELLSNLAHEIRTPVTSIRGYAQTLSQGGVDKETQEEFLRTIHRNALRIGTLVDDLLELEQLESGRGRPLDQENLVVADVADKALGTLRMQIEEGGATINNKLSQTTRALGDADALERIFLNLFGNALSYGGKGVTLSITEQSKDGELFIRVSDDGPGVSGEQRERLFERFFRGEEGRSSKSGGSGLGLAIARQLAQSMGGSLYLVESEQPGLHIEIRLSTGARAASAKPIEPFRDSATASEETQDRP